MNRYDCSKMLDCVHELRRLCDSNSNKKCEDECPLHGQSCSVWTLTQTEIDILQKWSDEHPEPPKIRKRELDFITMFKWHEYKRVERGASGYLFLVFDEDGEEYKYCLCNSWFSFIENGESMTFEELMKLEVEE